MNKRRGRTVHLSTVFVFVFALSFCALTIVPGQRCITQFVPKHRWLDVEEELQHGWPFVYSRRDIEIATPPIWTPWSSATEFSITALIADVAIALIVAGTIAAVFRRRRLRRTRLLQIQLVDIFVAITVIALVLAWTHSIYDSVKRETRAIQELNILTFKPKNPPDDPWSYSIMVASFANADTESVLPTWLDNLGFLPRFRHVIGLETSINNSERTSALANFSHLRYLHVSTIGAKEVDFSFLKHTRQLRLFHPYGTITDDDARHFVHLAKLEELDLSFTQISDAGMVHLSGLRNLKSLSLPDRISNDALRHIENLTNLETLHLPFRMENDNLDFLRRLTNLRELRLGRGLSENSLSELQNLKELRKIEGLPMDLTDEGLENLKELVNLENLNLDERKITDDGLRHLSDLSELEFLNLSRTDIGDDGVMSLSRLTKLKDIYLYGTRVTNEGVARLQQALPNCKISH